MVSSFKVSGFGISKFQDSGLKHFWVSISVFQFSRFGMISFYHFANWFHEPGT